MHLIQFLLPVYDNNRRRFSPTQFDSVRYALTQRFGGVTAYFRSPAAGLWKDGADTVSDDQVVMLEVITEELDTEWWAKYRSELEQQFNQKQLLVWALQVTML